MKICSKCKIEKDFSEFSKCKQEKDGLQYICKQCMHIYKKEWNKNNKKAKAEYNKKHIKKRREEYQNSKANYDTYASQISWANDPVRNINNFLQTKCTYCGKWFFPIHGEVQGRVLALNGQVGKGGAEMRLYCSIECKQACPIFAQKKYPKGHKKSYSREVQPELRQMVFERDEYTCIKCKKHQDDLNVPLYCHHIEGIRQNPIMSADIDMCVTVCKYCHKEIHQQKDCNYNDMQCKTK